MESAELDELVSLLRRTGGEPAGVEVKDGRGGVPQSLAETLSAFSNGAGGVVVLGISETEGFSVVPLADASVLRDGAAQVAREQMTPALQVVTEIVTTEAGNVVVIEVPPARASERPVYVTSRGVMTGSYTRGGDGDRRLTDAEIAVLVSERSQPTFDREPVPGTGAADLDGPAVTRTLQRVRESSRSLRDASDLVALCRIGVLVEPTPASTVTLAGLLAFGQYPQQHFPQLMTSVVVHAPRGSEPGTRFLDNVTLRGSIPEQVDGALRTIRRNLGVRAQMSDTGRTDVEEFPVLAVREALVNAVLHRDYSPVTRGTQVQVELHPDRLEIKSPGGLFGVVEADLGTEGISSSRNALLASLLSDAYLPNSSETVAENRASGIPAMIRLTRDRGLPRPQFRDRILGFSVSMTRSELLSPAVRRWLDALELEPRTTAHEIAVAMALADRVTSAAMREWGVDQVAAGRVFRDLGAQGLLVKHGGRRYAYYTLDPAVARPSEPSGTAATAGPDLAGEPSTRERVTAIARREGEVSAIEIQSELGLSRAVVVRHINALLADGRLRALGAPRSPQRTYRWIGES